ncbi:hypothetical protein C6502_04050 [Candidatus Poribacteria bacterium]|nr:MAG: hypothetical protein C6502_04050 [Candidatus Poribacteria bacterium]
MSQNRIRRRQLQMADKAMHKNLKSMQIRQIVISTATLAIGIAIFVIFISCDSQQNDPTPAPPPSPIVISELTQTQIQKCTLFFFDTNSLRLAGEERELNLSQDVTERLKQTINELLKDSISGLYQTIPQGTLLYEVYVDEQSTVYLDFSHHLKDEHIGGTTSEALTVAAILRTVKVNFPDEIRKVQILIEGLETDTIGGHVDISKPLSLSLDLEVVSRQGESIEAESTEIEPTEAEILEADTASEWETDR